MTDDQDEIIRKTVSLPASLWKRIEDFQFDVRMKRETHAVRQLIELGLEVHEREKRKSRPKS
jgi:hypothetical protein